MMSIHPIFAALLFVKIILTRAVVKGSELLPE